MQLQHHHHPYTEALSEISSALLARSSLPNVFHLILDHAVQWLAATEGFVFLVNGDSLDLKATWSSRSEFDVTCHHRLVHHVWRSGHLLQETDFNLLTTIGLPLAIRGQVVGVWGLLREGEGPFRDYDIQGLQHFAQLACVAIDYSHLYQSAQQGSVERRRVEEALGQEKERLAITLRSIGDGVITADLEGRVQLMNAAAEQLTGWSQSEAEGQPIREVFHLVHAITRERPRDPISQVLSGKQTVGLPNQTVLIAKDQREWFISASTSPIKTTTGRVAGVVITFRDITRHKQTEEALRKSEAQNRAILNAIPDLMIRMSREGTVLDFKGEGQDPVARQQNSPLSDFFPTAVVQQKLRAIRKALETGQMQMYSYQLGSEEGGTREFEARLVVSGPQEVLAIVQDVTARKAAELQQQQQRERERLLAGIALRIRRSLNLDDILRTTAAEVRELLQVDRVVIHQFQPSGDSWVIAESVTAAWPTALGQVLQGPWMIDAKHQQQGYIRAISDLDHDDYVLSGPLQQFLLRLQVKAILVVPLFFQNSGLWGILAAQHCAIPHEWQLDEISLLEKLATQVEIAIQQAQLYQQVQTLNNDLERQVRVRTAQLNKQVSALQLQAQLLDAVESGVVATDQSGHIIYWNAHAQSLYGLSEADALGEAVVDVIPFSPVQIREMNQALAQDDKWSGELTLPQSDGSYTTVFVENTPMRGQGGLPQGFTGVSVDITERKQAEDALRESEEKFRTLTETATSGIFIFRDTFLDVNPALSDITGFSRDELLHQPFWSVIHPKFRRLARRFGHHQLARMTQEAAHFEFQIITRRGEERWIDCTTGLITFKGEPAILGTAFDITQRKVTEFQLQSKMKELEELNVLKDDFLSTVSHELRTPMSNMRMAIHMLKMMVTELEKQDPSLQESAAKANRYITVLHDECLRETELINDLLDLQRLEAGSQHLHYEPIELETFLPHLLNSFVARTQQREQTLILEPQTDFPILYSDPACLTRILAELVNNACKYSPPGAAIKLQTSWQTDYLQFQVTNTGVEIEPEVINRVFDKFYRIPHGDRWKQGGTGLGLALIKRLVEELCGRIWVESSEQLTSFFVRLPRDLNESLQGPAKS